MTTKRDIEREGQNPADNAGSLGKKSDAPSVGGEGVGEKLEPCPFCAGQAEMRYWDWPYERWIARCTDCKTSARTRLSTEAKAVAAWNTRAENSQVLTLTAQRDEAMTVVRWVHENFTMLDLSHTEFRVEAAHLAAKLLKEFPK